MKKKEEWEKESRKKRKKHTGIKKKDKKFVDNLHTFQYALYMLI